MKTMVYSFMLDENEIIAKRKKLMSRIMVEPLKYTAMYVHGDWMRLYIFKHID